MSSRKRKRRERAQQNRHARAGRSRGGLPFTASHAFIAIIVLIVVLAAAVALISGDRQPRCPPGQVWSDEHNHCH